MREAAWLVVAALLACKSQPTAMDACKRLVEAGVAANCRETKPGGLWAAAVEGAEFDLPSVPGKMGYTMRFEKVEHYDRVVDAFAAAALIAGPHRYGNRDKLVFTQFNEAASLETGKAAKAAIEGL